MTSNLPNLFELLGLDVNRDWTFEAFEQEIKKKRNKHNALWLKASKKDQRDKSKEIVEFLENLKIDQRTFKSHLDVARDNNALIRERQLEQAREDLHAKLQIIIIDGYIHESKYQALHTQSIALEFEANFKLLTQDLEKIPHNYQEQKVGRKDLYLEMLANLKQVGKHDLYDLLELPPNTPTEELIQATGRLYNRYSRSSKDNRPYQDLSVQAKKFLGEDKQLYDEYLLCGRIEPVWGLLDEFLTTASEGVVPPQKAEQILSTVKKRLATSELSDEGLFTSVKLYALRQHGVWVVKPREPAPAATTGAAPAPAPIPPPIPAPPTKPVDERERIKDEAERLWKQRKYQQAFDKIGEAIALKPRAQDMLSRACRELRDRIQSDQMQFETTRKAVREAYDDKRLIAARSQMTDWERLAPAGDPEVSDFKRKIDAVFAKRQSLIDNAGKALKKQAFSDALTTFTEALGMCADDREGIEQQRVVIIKHLRDQALLLEQQDSNGAIRQLTELSTLLAQNAINDDFGIADALARIDSVSSSRAKLLELAKLHLSKNEIRATRRLISDYPDQFRFLPVLQQIGEREEQIAYIARIAAQRFKEGKYSDAFQDYQHLTNDLCSDDTDFNAFYAFFGDHVMKELRGLEGGRAWDALETRARRVDEEAELLGLNKHREEILSLLQRAITGRQELQTARNLTQAAVSEKRYFAANRHLQQWEMLSTVTDKELQETKQAVERAISQANRLYDSVRQVGNPFGKQAQALYQQALAICADHPDVLLRVGKILPPAPQNFRVSELQPGKLEFRWDPLPNADAAGITYHVYGLNGKIGETRNPWLVHTNVENGVRQRFYVVAVLNNISSAMSNDYPYTVLRDVERVSTKLLKDGKLLLTWAVPYNVSRVLIMRNRDRSTLRNLPGDQTRCEIPLNEIGDDQIIIVCRYDINSQTRLESDGVRVALNGLQQPVESQPRGIRDLSVWLTRNQVFCRWTWQTAFRQATIEVIANSPRNPKTLASKEVSAFERDQKSEYRINLNSELQPGDNVSVKIQIPGFSSVTVKKQIAHTYFTYRFEVKKRLFGAPEYALVVEAHNLVDPVTLHLDLHQSSHPIDVPLDSTLIETLKLSFSPAAQTLTQKIEKRKPTFSFARIFPVPMPNADAVYLIEPATLRSEQPQLP